MGLEYEYWNNLECTDANIQSEDEGFTALHFSARYVPKMVDMGVELQDPGKEGTSEHPVHKLTSERAMLYLLDLKGKNKVQVCMSM